MSLPAVTTRLYSSDEVQYFSYLRSLYVDRDVSFENEYLYFYERNIAQSAGFHETFLERETAAGRRVNYATMGAAILWLPFYGAADVWTRITGAAEPNGLTQPYISAVAYGSAFYGFLAVLLSVRAARVLLRRGGPTSAEASAGKPGVRGSGSPGPLLPALALWFGTPLLFYMYVAPPFSHACSAFAVALFVNVWLHVRERWTPRGAFVLGLCAALMAMVREQDAFIAVGPALDFLWASACGPSEAPPFQPKPPPSPEATAGNLRENSRRRLEGSPPKADRRARARGGEAPRALINAGRMLTAGSAGLAGFILGYAPQLLAYTALNGYPGPAEHVSRKMYWYSPHALQVLASPHHGFFFWTPLAVLAIAGLFWVKDRRVAACLLLMVASQVYVAGSVESWTVAGAFGQRRFVCLTVVLAIGLTALWTAVKRPRYVLGTVIALMAWWNIALMAQFATRLMDRQRLEPASNAYHAFVTLPLKAPSLVYRYLADRDSFYESGGANR